MSYCKICKLYFVCSPKNNLFLDNKIDWIKSVDFIVFVY